MTRSGWEPGKVDSTPQRHRRRGGGGPAWHFFGHGPAADGARHHRDPRCVISLIPCQWVWRRRCTRPLPPTILHKPVTQGSLRTSLVESHPQDRSQYGMHPSLLRPAGRATPATGAAAALGLPNLLPSDPAPEYQDWQEARTRERSPLTEQGSSVAACHRDSLPAWFALPENLTHRLIATDPPHTAMSLQDSLERCSRWWSYCSLSSFTICPVQCKLDRP